jgi:hypothetical protein
MALLEQSLKRSAHRTLNLSLQDTFGRSFDTARLSGVRRKAGQRDE